VFIAPADNLDALAVMQHAHLLAHLRDAAQQGCDFFADEGFTLRFVARAEHPRRKSDQAEQGNSNEELSLHALSPKVVPIARVACTISLLGSTNFITSSAFSRGTDSI